MSAQSDDTGRTTAGHLPRTPPTEVAFDLSRHLVTAAQRHKGNWVYGVYHRLAVIVRGGLSTTEPESSKADERHHPPSGDGRGAAGTRERDGPQRAAKEERLWDRARACVSKVGTARQGYVFLARAEGAGEAWYRAIGTLLAVKFPDVTFRNASESKDDSGDEAGCLLACSPPGVRANFYHCCFQVGTTPSQLAADLGWMPIVDYPPDDDCDGGFHVTCPYHGQ